MNKTIILVCSPLPRMGKDTFGSVLINKLNYKRFSFADKVKEIACSFGWDGKKDDKGRKLLINVGMMGREYRQNIWVDFVLNQIQFDKNNSNYVITDCRFLNEQNLTKERFDNVFTIGIESDIFGDKNLSKDASQIEYYNMKKDFIIKNNSSLEDFEYKILEVMRNIHTLQNT